jgi:Carbohydrate family 9 binding domain-like
MRIPFLTFIISLLMTSAVNAALVHTPTLPKGISYTAEELPDHAIYLEGESLGKNNKSDSFPQKHQAITVFRTAAKPNNYWGAIVSYDRSRIATRGAEKRNYPAHQLIWKDVKQDLKPGIYDVYVRCMVSPKGSQTFSFKKGVNVKSLQYAKGTEPVTQNKANISWIRIGSVDLLKGDDSFKLTVSAKQTPVRIDTVLLVKVPASKDLPLQLERQPNTNAISDRPGGLVFATETAIITYNIQSFKKLKNLAVKIMGVNGQVLQEIQNPKLTPVEKENAQLKIKLPGRGYFVVTLNAKTKSRRVVNTTTAAVLGEPIDEAKRMKSRFGLATISGYKPLMKAANGRWNRRLRSIFRIKKSDLSKKTSPYKPLTKKTFDLVGALSFGLPNWLMDMKGKKHHGFGNAFMPPKDWNQLDEVLDYYFEKNKKRLSGFLEVYNEPIAHWRGTSKELVRFHHAVAKSVKKARPDIKVLGPCLSAIHMDKLEQLTRLGLFDKLDGIVMHAYVNNSTPETIYLDRLMNLNAFRKRTKDGRMPVFLTEFGWTSAEGTWQVPVDELTQAQFCARSLALGLSENIDAMVYFCMEYRTRNAGEAGFSLIAPYSGRPKPGFVAFSTIARLFADATPVTRLKLLPDVYMVVAKSSNHYVAALWSTQQNYTLEMPFPVSSAIDMVGQTISLSNSGKLPVSPSPIYIQMADFPIDKVKSKQNALHLQGQDLPTSSGKLFAFNAAWYKKGKFKIPSNAMPGQYLLLAKKGNRWQPQTITVQRPFDITSAKVDWPLKQDFPALRVILTSQIDKDTLPVHLSLKTDKIKSPTSSYLLAPRTVRETRFDLRHIPFGERLKGTLYARSTWQKKKITLTTPLDLTVIPAYRTSKVKTWNQIPAMNFTNWNPWRKLNNTDKAQPDCMAQLKCRYSANALELAVRVQDDEHKQNQAEKNSSRMWGQDSLQIAFDMDIDKPWVAGVGGQDLLGGHRVFEFTIAKNTNSSSGVAFRHTSYLKEFPANMVEPAIKVHVERTGNITDYRVIFPWRVLGFKEPATPGKRIGFALLVNDVDPTAKRKRHGVRLFAGIAESKDPKQYGPLWLR